MKKKHYSYILGFCTAMIGFQACSSEDNLAETNAPQPTPETPVYKVNIHATIGDDAETRAVSFGNDGSSITASFATSDLIYVYNETKGSFAFYGDGTAPTATTLAPESDGTSTTLTGTLKFPDPVVPEAGDILTLYYNMNVFYVNEHNYLNPTECGFKYVFTGPNPGGSAAIASNYDFAKATMKIKAISSANATDGYTLDLCKVDDNNNTTATFEPLQSMFRFRFAFAGKTPSDYPTIRQLVVESDYTVSTSPKSGPFVDMYAPLHGPQNMGSNIRRFTNVIIDENYDFYLPMRFNYESVPATENLTFTAIASDGVVYEKVRTAPAGGFKNGKYYYGGLTFAEAAKPTIVGTSSYDGGTYTITSDANISGTSKGYLFYIDTEKVDILTLSGLNAVYYGAGAAVIGGGTNNNHILTIELDGDCVIKNMFKGGAIVLENTENLNLKTSGSEQTLTITVRPDGGGSVYKGLQAQGYWSDSHDVANLAAPGFTVSLTSEIDNGDGTTTYVYTVAPKVTS